MLALVSGVTTRRIHGRVGGLVPIVRIAALRNALKSRDLPWLLGPWQAGVRA